MPNLINIMKEFEIGRFNIVCTPDQRRLSLVPDALHLKAHHPENVFVFGGLDISPLFMMPENAGQIFSDYVISLLNMGCDGIKMIEGKPQIRKTLPIPPFDSPSYAPYWETMEDRQVPLIFHVNDPEEFWDPQRVPEWARERGWFYGDGTYINNEDQYHQVINVLKRHPNLNVIFAHFFFLSAQLDRLRAYLDEFPNMCVDLTPGIEMYANFSAHPDQARDFFNKYQDRILYGTDIGAKALLATPEIGIERGESQARIELVRNFLESDSEYWVGDDGGFLFGKRDKPFQGLNLPGNVLRKIYYQNFERICNSTPRKLEPVAVIAECQRLEMMIEAMGAATPGGSGDPSVAKQVKSFFETLI
jgi:predicted TIM-barrel fold metal-dependent hydrolase